MVNSTATQLLVVWKNPLKHHANHLIHFPSPFLMQNMLICCWSVQLERPDRSGGLSCGEVKRRAGGNGAGPEEWPIFPSGKKRRPVPLGSSVSLCSFQLQKV